jgi:hypothetical protein
MRPMSDDSEAYAAMSELIAGMEERLGIDGRGQADALWSSRWT